MVLASRDQENTIQAAEETPFVLNQPQDTALLTPDRKKDWCP